MKVLITSFPKSGSSYLCVLIGNLPGFSIQSYVPAYGRREQELCEVKLDSVIGVERQVAQHHVRASEHTLRLIDKYRLTPIVLVRNIYDVAVSIADHIVNESPVGPMAYFDDGIARLPIRDRVHAAMDLAIPWYFNFYVSWWRERPEAIATYEDLILGGPVRQTSYLRSIGLNAEPAEVIAAHEMTKGQNTRFNVGITGRGTKLVNASRRKHVERLASYYPDVDFSPIGIGKRRSSLAAGLRSALAGILFRSKPMDTVASKGL
jgi:hypothetical protein